MACTNKVLRNGFVAYFGPTHATTHPQRVEQLVFCFYDIHFYFYMQWTWNAIINAITQNCRRSANCYVICVDVGPVVFVLYVTPFRMGDPQTDVTLNRFQFNLFLLVMHILLIFNSYLMRLISVIL